MSDLCWEDLSPNGRAWVRKWATDADGHVDWNRVNAGVRIGLGGQSPRRVARQLGIDPEVAAGIAHDLKEAMADALAFEGLTAAYFLEDPTGELSGQVVARTREIRKYWSD